MPESIETILRKALRRASLSAQAVDSEFPSSELTFRISSNRTEQLVGYIWLCPIKSETKAQAADPQLRTLLSRFAKTKSDPDGFAMEIRFSVGPMPPAATERVCKFRLDEMGWQSRLVPFLRRLPILPEDLGPSPEIYF